MTIEQKDPSNPTGPAGGDTSAGTSGLSKTEKLAVFLLAVAALLIYFFK